MKRFLQGLFTCGSILMLVMLMISPLFLLYLASTLHISSSFIINSHEDNTPDNISSLVVPLVPFLNIPSNYLLSFWLISMLSSFLHELGHGLAAITENIEIEGIGYFLLLAFPGAYVTLSPTLHKLEIKPKLKIYSAGIACNALVAICAGLLLAALPLLLLPLVTRHSSGVTIVAMHPLSTLQQKLSLGDTLQAINGHVIRDNAHFREMLQALQDDSALLPPSARSTPLPPAARSTLLHSLDPLDDTNTSTLPFELLIHQGYCSPVPLDNSSDLCMDLLRGRPTSNHFCFLHTPSDNTLSYSVLAGDIHRVFDPVLTHFHRPCSNDHQCLNERRHCLHLLHPATPPQRLVILTTSPPQDPSRHYHLFYLGSLSPLVSDLTLSSYHLRPWLYHSLGIHKTPTWHHTLLRIKNTLTTHCKLILQINVSAVLINALPLIHVDGGMILPLLLKHFFPRTWQPVSIAITHASTLIVLLVSIVGLWPLVRDSSLLHF